MTDRSRTGFKPSPAANACQGIPRTKLERRRTEIVRRTPAFAPKMGNT